MLKIFQIVLYVIGGFFVYVASLLSFISMASLTIVMKLGITSMFGIMALIIILIAMAMGSFKAWKMPVGIALLGGVGTTIFVVFTIIYIEASPELLQSIPDFRSPFTDYTVGSITTFSFFIIGAALILVSIKKSVK